MADSAMLHDDFNLLEYLQKLLVHKKEEPSPPEPECYWFCTNNHFANRPLTPFSNNVMTLGVMAIYYKICLEMACWIRIQWDQRLLHGRGRRGRPMVHWNILSKSILQMCLTSVLVFWPYFDVGTSAMIPLSSKSLPPPTVTAAADGDGWSWKLAALLPAVVMARLLYKGLLVRNPTDIEVQTQSVCSSPSELLLGPLFLAAVMFWLTLYQFMTEEAAIVAAACLGDAMAPLIGTTYGRHLYSVPLSKTKTMEGSVVGVFLGTVAASYFYLYMMGIPLLPLRIILAYAGIAAVAEGTSPANCDNFVTCVMLHFSMDRVKLMLAA
jgi:hypothetical protein